MLGLGEERRGVRREKENAMGAEEGSGDSLVQDAAGLAAIKCVWLSARLQLPEEKHPGL